MDEHLCVFSLNPTPQKQAFLNLNSSSQLVLYFWKLIYLNSFLNLYDAAEHLSTAAILLDF